MVKKSYNSTEYYAQKFRSFLKGEDKTIFKNLGFSFPDARQYKNTVFFKYLGKINNYVSFEKIKNKDYICLEMILINENEIKREKRKSRFIKIQRSKSGRISDNYFPKIFQNFVLENNKKFYNEECIK